MTNNLQQTTINKKPINALIVSLSLLIVCFWLFIPFLAHAVDTVYQPLEQVRGLTSESGNSGSGIDIEKYLPNIIKFAIGLASALAVIYLIIGGFQYISSDAMFEKSEGKERIKNALLGLFLAISSVVILNTISPRLVDIKLDIKRITPDNLLSENGYKQPAKVASGSCICANRFVGVSYKTISQYNVDDSGSCEKACSCDKTDLYGYLTKANLGYKEVKLSCPLGSPSSRTWPSDEEERAILKDLSSNITFNNDDRTCTFIGEESCTSVAGISPLVLNSVGQLAKDCDCEVRISGGTEYWLHSPRTEHNVGGKVIDFSLTPTLNTFLRTKAKNVSKTEPDACTAGTERYRYKNGLYVNENTGVISASNGPHWHVCYY